MCASYSENAAPAANGAGAGSAPGNDEIGVIDGAAAQNPSTDDAPAGAALRGRGGRGSRGGRGRGAADAGGNQLPLEAPPARGRGRGRPRGPGNRGNRGAGTPRPVSLHRSVLPAQILESSDEEGEALGFLREDADVPPDADGAWTMCAADGGKGGFVPGSYHQSSKPLMPDDSHSQLPYFFLSCFFDEDFWLKIEQETNRFMYQHGVSESLHTNVIELKSWFGLLMIIAHHNMPNLDLYWEQPNYSLPHLLHPYFRPVMPRHRFSFLSQNIHLVNNLDDVGRDNLNRDPLFKLRWVVEKFNKRCKKVWQLGVHVSPDEGLIPTYSPNPIESFCPKPGGSYGVLIRFTCCAEKWFCYHIFVEDKISRTLSEKLDLMLGGVKAGQICYIDRFYTTYDTVMHLHNKGLGVVGTCMANRFPRTHLHSSCPTAMCAATTLLAKKALSLPSSGMTVTLFIVCATCMVLSVLKSLVWFRMALVVMCQGRWQ